MPIPRPDPALVERFRACLEALTGSAPDGLGVAVSGGPDSLALLLLAASAYPGRIEAATVDHGLRPESGKEAAAVAAVSARLAVPHAILPLAWPAPPARNVQAVSREARYRALSSWALDRNLPLLATAHHLDDQAETILMRLARGAGLSGLAGTRAVLPVASQQAQDRDVRLVRPLLGWRRAELARLVAAAAVTAIDDPSNRDPRHDRTRFRALLAAHPELAPKRLAAAAAHLADADDAMSWMTRELFARRVRREVDGAVTLDIADLPRELQRRLLGEGLGCFEGASDPPGPKLARLLDALRAGCGGTLAGVLATPGECWRLSEAPPRR